MVASLIGDLSLLVGFAVLLLPLLLTEMSRSRDGLWGAVLLLMGLVLVTSSDRFTGAPMIAVICGLLLITRLGLEVARSRWNYLSDHEKTRIGSLERWTNSFKEFGATLANKGGFSDGVVKLFSPKPNRSSIGKKWVRPEKSKDLQSQEEAKIASSDVLQETKDALSDLGEVSFDQKGASQDS